MVFSNLFVKSIRKIEKKNKSIDHNKAKLFLSPCLVVLVKVFVQLVLRAAVGPVWTVRARGHKNERICRTLKRIEIVQTFLAAYYL